MGDDFRDEKGEMGVNEITIITREQGKKSQVLEFLSGGVEIPDISAAGVSR
jgi:hypothetical protein